MTANHSFIQLLLEKKQNFIQELQKCSDLQSLKNLQIKYLGKKSLIIEKFNNLTIIDKKQFSQPFQVWKTTLLTLWQTRQQELSEIKNLPDFDQLFYQKLYDRNFQNNFLLPIHTKPWLGNNHPLLAIIDQLHYFFQTRNFQFFSAPDLTTIDDNFTILNIGSQHPARDFDSCYFINQQQLLRTHSTNFTSQILQKHYHNYDNQRFFAYTIGNVYRNDTDDATHIPKFLQLDACLWGPGINLVKLKGLLTELLQFLFGKSVKLRFRMNYFPFTLPSIEVDLSCFKCQTNSNCATCKGSGWIEILGAGIVHPQVLKNCQIPGKPIILALGIGIERLAMLKYGVDDLRLFTQAIWTNEDSYAL